MLKKFLFASTVVCVAAITAYASLKSNIVGPTLSADQAAKTFGSRPFKESDFKSGTSIARSKMAAEILKKQLYVGASFEEVKNSLGKFTGYFWNDQFPTYVLNEEPINGSEIWQLTFLPGKQGKVGKVVINRNNCCAK